MKYICGNCNNHLEEQDIFCPKCGYGVLEAGGSMVIKDKEVFKAKRMKYINPKELEVANLIIKNIPDLKITNRCEDYTTLLYGESDVCRIDYVKETIILYLCPSNEDRKIYAEHPYFDLQVDKKKVFWKTRYNKDDLDFYIKIIKNTMIMDDSFKKEG